MAGFDPYHVWLGIPPREQPPDHYRMLGIVAFESDMDVIGNAADLRMRYVRTFQAGKHAEECRRILNQLASARVCLLNDEKRAANDVLSCGEDRGARATAVSAVLDDAKSDGSRQRASTLVGGLSARAHHPRADAGLARPAWRRPPRSSRGCPSAVQEAE